MLGVTLRAGDDLGVGVGKLLGVGVGVGTGVGVEEGVRVGKFRATVNSFSDPELLAQEEVNR